VELELKRPIDRLIERLIALEECKLPAGKLTMEFSSVAITILALPILSTLAAVVLAEFPVKGTIDNCRGDPYYATVSNTVEADSLGQ
jgi:hypothetical protein